MTESQESRQDGASLMSLLKKNAGEPWPRVCFLDMKCGEKKRFSLIRRAWPRCLRGSGGRNFVFTWDSVWVGPPARSHARICPPFPSHMFICPPLLSHVSVCICLPTSCEPACFRPPMRVRASARQCDCLSASHMEWPTASVPQRCQHPAVSYYSDAMRAPGLLRIVVTHACQ